MELEAREVTFYYPGKKKHPVLDHVNLTIAPGERVGLKGKSGRGKTTLCRLLAGYEAPKGGQILLDGKAYCPSSPSDAQRRGVQTIFQQPALLPNLSVAENLCIGAWPFRHGRFLHVDWKAIYAQAEESFRELGCRIDVHAAAQELNLAQQRLVELVKVSRSDARVLIVDELDSVLTVQELAPVFRVLRSLRARGMSVLYISHRIESLAALCDRVCIIREGQIRDTLDAGDPDSRGRLIERLCRAPESQRHPRIYQPAGRVVLQAEGLSTAHGLRGASLQLRKGEVLGIAGFLGSGRSALARALFGIDPLLTGSITLNQAKLSLRSPNDAVRHGIGYISDASADELLCEKSSHRAEHHHGEYPRHPGAIPSGSAAGAGGLPRVPRKAGHPDRGGRRTGAAPVARQPAEGAAEQVDLHELPDPDDRRALPQYRPVRQGRDL